MQQILDTPVSIPLRNILGASKELSSNFQDVIKLKNSPSKFPSNLAAYECVDSFHIDAETRLEENFNPDYSVRYTNEQKALIKLPLYSNRKSIVALIDTGSQINMVSKRVAEEIIQLPINYEESIVMNDANGNATELKGLISKAPLRCGEVLTEGDLYLGPPGVPFDLLLGQPWQRCNMITIDKRDRGTYIVFKDVGSGEAKCEVLVVNSAQIFKVPRNSHLGQVYTAVENLDNKDKEKPQEESETLPTRPLDPPEESLPMEIHIETPGEIIDGDLKIDEESAQDISQDLAIGLERIHLENLLDTQPEPPSRVLGGSLDILAAVCDQIDRVSENLEREIETAPKRDTGEIIATQNELEDSWTSQKTPAEVWNLMEKRQEYQDQVDAYIQIR